MLIGSLANEKRQKK